MGRIRVCSVLAPVRYEDGRQLFFWFVSQLLSKTKTYLKWIVLSKLLEVTVHVCIASSSTFARSAPKDSAWKTVFFCMCYILKTKRRSTKTIITEWCFSCPNKSVCQKVGWSCKKWKSTQKVIYTLFFKKTFNYSQHCICIEWTALKTPIHHLYKYRTCDSAKDCASVDKSFILPKPLAKWLDTCPSTRTLIQHVQLQLYNL